MLTTTEEHPLAEVTACQGCGYLIAGLPPAGRCPECGVDYDRRDLFTLGRLSRGAWAPWVSAGVLSIFAFTWLRHPRGWPDVVMGIIWASSGVGFATATVTRWVS